MPGFYHHEGEEAFDKKIENDTLQEDQLFI